MSTPIDIDGAVQRLHEIKTTIETLTEEKQGLQALLITTLGADTKTDAAGFKITIGKPVERINTRRLTEAFPLDQNPGLYRAVIDTKKVREQVAPATLAALDVFDTGTPTVTIR